MVTIVARALLIQHAFETMRMNSIWLKKMLQLIRMTKKHDFGEVEFDRLA